MVEFLKRFDFPVSEDASVGKARPAVSAAEEEAAKANEVEGTSTCHLFDHGEERNCITIVISCTTSKGLVNKTVAKSYRKLQYRREGAVADVACVESFVVHDQHASL